MTLPPPKISVIIPVHDRKECIHQALDSLELQSVQYDQFEVIIITNINLSNLNHYSFRLTVKHSTHLELSLKLIEGITESHGEVMCFLEDDDTFLQGKLQYVVDLFEYQDVSYYHNSLRYTGKHGGLINTHFPNTKREKEIRFVDPHKLMDDGLRSLFVQQADFNLSSISIRKDYFAQYLVLLQKMRVKYIDTFFFLCALSAGKAMAFGGPIFTNIKIHNRNASGSHRAGFKEITKIDKLGEIVTFIEILHALIKTPLPVYEQWERMALLDDRLKGRKLSRTACAREIFDVFISYHGKLLRKDVAIKGVAYMIGPNFMNFILKIFHE